MTQDWSVRFEGMDEIARNVYQTFSAIEEVYVGALRAMGLVPEVRQSVTNSAEVYVSFSQDDRIV